MEGVLSVFLEVLRCTMLFFNYTFLDDFFLYHPTYANFTWRLFKVCLFALQAGMGLRMK